MMPGHVAAIVLIAYASLAIELAVLRVGSVVSSASIWKAQAPLVSTFSRKYRRLFALGKPAKALLAAPLLVVYAVYAYPLLVIGLGPDPLGDYLFTPTAVAESAAIALTTAGRAVALAAALTLRDRHGFAGAPTGLEGSGPFRWSRNPGLVGMYVFVGGMWLAMPSASLAAGIAIYAAYMHVKVRMEEDFLANKFGRRYAEYRLKTGRYWP